MDHSASKFLMNEHQCSNVLKCVSGTTLFHGVQHGSGTATTIHHLTVDSGKINDSAADSS